MISLVAIHNMPSVQAFLAVSTSVWLLEHASGSRIEAPTQYKKCEYAGPEGGPPFKISFELDQPGDCKFICTQAWPHEFGTRLMPKLFDAEFVPRSNKGAFCKCNLHESSTTIIRFFENTKGFCEPTKCWQKYLTALNYGVEDDALQVKRETLRAQCIECENEADCQPEFNLVHVDTLAREMRALQQTQLAAVSAPNSAAESAPAAVETVLPEDFVAAMQKAGIILDDEIDSAVITEQDGVTAPVAAVLSSASPREPTPLVAKSSAAPAPLSVDMSPCGQSFEGPFPSQCLVKPGGSGVEWFQQLSTQGCTGNQFVVQIEDGVAIAITVDGVEDLLDNTLVPAAPSAAYAAMGIDEHDEVHFTETFRIRKVEGRVRIGISDLAEGAEPTLNYFVTDDTITTPLAGTQGLFLKVEEGGVTVEQHKPEEAVPSDGWLWASATSYKRPPPFATRLSPLNPEKYANPCTTT